MYRFLTNRSRYPGWGEPRDIHAVQTGVPSEFPRSLRGTHDLFASTYPFWQGSNPSRDISRRCFMVRDYFLFNFGFFPLGVQRYFGSLGDFTLAPACVGGHSFNEHFVFGESLLAHHLPTVVGSLSIIKRLWRTNFHNDLSPITPTNGNND